MSSKPLSFMCPLWMLWTSFLDCSRLEQPGRAVWWTMALPAGLFSFSLPLGSAAPHCVRVMMVTVRQWRRQSKKKKAVHSEVTVVSEEVVPCDSIPLLLQLLTSDQQQVCSRFITASASGGVVTESTPWRASHDLSIMSAESHAALTQQLAWNIQSRRK